MYNKILLINGAKRAGKDTFYNLFSNLILGHCGRYAFADELKKELRPFILDQYAIDLLDPALDSQTEKKELIRPLMIAHGEVRRKQDKNYWIKKVINSISDEFDERIIPNFKQNIAVITDCRYLNEYQAFVDAFGKDVVRLVRIERPNFILAPEPTEIANNKMLDDSVDYFLRWPEANGDINSLKLYVEDVISVMSYNI